MTVISTEESKPRKQYTYSTSLSFPITFSYIERNEVKCMINDTVLTYNTDYTVPEFDPTSLADNQLNLTLIIVPTVGDTVTIYRKTKQDQQAVFPQNAKFSSQKITEAVDKLTMICQELSEDLETCIQLSKETPIGFNTTLPAPEANQVIQWDENGTQLINYDLRSEISTIDGKANTAISTADDAKTIANGAVNTANSASSTASSAIDIASEALTTAGTAKTKAETAETNSSAAIGTANAAYDAASSAVNTANTANTNANTAVSTANSAMSKATTAKNTADTAASNALSAISTANTASTNASTAINTANNAKDTADAAVVTANAASENASTAVNTATSADETATAASNKVDAFGEDIEAVLEAAEKINELEEAVETATEAATTASNAAENATEAATTATNAAQTATTKAQEATNAVASIKQADWNQTDDTQKDYIKNKPTIPTMPTVDQTYDGTSANAQSGVAIAGAKFISNTASDALGYSITIGGTTATDICAVNIGRGSVAGEGAVAVGSSPGTLSTQATGQYAVAIGSKAQATANNAIQIGFGTNSTANSFAIGYHGTSIQMLDCATSLIPDARLSSNIQRKLQTINVLYTSGTITLTDNSVNTITPTANITFTLPTVTDNTVFHQILVQLNLSTVYTINLGLGNTPHYFNKTAPNLSATGVYNLIYEYDKANQYWVCGCLPKGVAS